MSPEDELFYRIAEQKFEERLREELIVQASEDPGDRYFGHIQEMFEGYGRFLEADPMALMTTETSTRKARS